METILYWDRNIESTTQKEQRISYRLLPPLPPAIGACWAAQVDQGPEPAQLPRPECLSPFLGLQAIVRRWHNEDSMVTGALCLAEREVPAPKGESPSDREGLDVGPKPVKIPVQPLFGVKYEVYATLEEFCVKKYRRWPRQEWAFAGDSPVMNQEQLVRHLYEALDLPLEAPAVEVEF